MPEHNLSVEETRRRGRILRVDGYHVALDLRAARHHDRSTFGSVTTVRFTCAEPGATTHVDLVAPVVHAITLNGRALDPGTAFDGARIVLGDLAGDNELVVHAECAYSRTGEGMHRFVDPVDGETYLYTHYEPADARRVFANFEQPDLKAPYTFDVTAPDDWTVLSNAPAARPEPAGDGAATWRFEPSGPLSTYITAVVAGPYHRVRDLYSRPSGDGSTLEVPLSVLCRASLAEHLDAEAIHAVTKQGLDFFHDHFDYPYPFGKYDQVFVPEYNIGAMENPGCVTFKEGFVFRGKATRAQHEQRANVILHEMAHMWFGDLVTMQWWDDLWLKESFADYMGALAQAEATEFTAGWVTFANRRKARAYRADQLPTTHPVTAVINDLEDAKLNFDGITYAKGASVLKQLVAYVGRDAFLEGARRYFKRHAYGNTTLVDLLAVLEETSGRDLGAWSKAWLETAGVNVLTPRVSCVDGIVSELVVDQEATADHPAMRPHRVAVGLYRRDQSGALVRADRAEVDVTGMRTVVPELAGAPEPDLVLVNDGDLTYCKMRFDDVSLQTVREHLGQVVDPMARALCWSALWNLTRDGLLPARAYVDLVLRFAEAESDVGVLQSLHEHADTAATHYASADWRAEGRGLLASAARRALQRAEPGSDHQLAWTRFLVGVAEAPEDLALLRDLLDGTQSFTGLRVDQDLRWMLLLALAAHDEVAEDDLRAELTRDDTASGELHLTRCLAARPSAEAKDAAWSSVVESDDLPSSMVDAVVAGFNQPGQRELIAPFAPAYFEALSRVWSTRTIEIAMRVVRGFFPSLQASPQTLAATDAWLAQAPDAPALRRLVLESRDDLARALRAQDCDARASAG